METTEIKLAPAAVSQVKDALVCLYNTENGALFKVTVNDESVTVVYTKTASGKLRYTVYDGDTAFFKRLRLPSVFNVERAVNICLRQAEYRERPF